MISIVLLLDDCYPDLADYILGLERVCLRNGESYEILIVANGVGSFLRSQFPNLYSESGNIRAFEFGARTTQAVCLKAVLREIQGEYVLICGSYQQLTEASILKVIQALDHNYDLINPWRQKRVDPSFNQIQSRAFNWLVGRLVQTDLHDYSCTIKFVRYSVLEETELYGNMFRFLPVLASAKGFRIKEVPVDHLQERGKFGFYSLSDYIGRLVDIFTLFFNTSFTRKPLRFFSSIGASFVMFGLLGILILLLQRFLFSMPIGNRPFLILSLMVTILGVMISSAGLLGEVIAFVNGRHKKEYTIEKIVTLEYLERKN